MVDAETFELLQSKLKILSCWEWLDGSSVGARKCR